MTRTGLPRKSTLLLWNAGWACMACAFLMASTKTIADGLKAAFMLQMYVAGFVTVVLTPMQGPDVALGSTDALHCYAAILYVADHVVANEFVLGVKLTSPFGIGFVIISLLCGIFQLLRAENDKYGRLFYMKVIGSRWLSFAVFKWALEVGFMLTENALFLVFLFGMTSEIRIVDDV